MRIHKVVTGVISVGILAVIGWGATSLIASPSQSAHALGTGPIVFFVPHQDDETLTMGASIIEHDIAGRDVHVVLIGDGTATSARLKLCNQGHNQFCDSNPNAKKLIGEARDKEFIEAVKDLGVDRPNIHFENKQETKVTIGMIQAIIDKYVNQYGRNASYATMSWLDANSDHYNLGYALNSRCVTTGPASKRVPPQLSDCRFYQSAVYHTATSTSFFKERDRVPTPPGGFYTADTSTKINRLKAAIAEYRFTNLASGRYGVGYLSVPDQFDYMLGSNTRLRSWWHKPSESWTVASEALSAQQFIARHQFTPGKDN